MADFAAGYEDWGLQAIVEGSTNFSMANNNNNNYFDDHHNLRLAFSELFGNYQNSSMVMDSDGLEAFYKPFYPISDSYTAISDHEQVQKKIETEEKLAEVKVQNQNHHHTDQSATIIEATNKCKKSCRKNQRKRSVVVQVTADDFSSDKWAWRKYGQKPIKGSIYPRSYYKCSSMKACLARKQVEQSCSDPTKYIITYTAEHCHSHPTRRNSLAGTVRNRFPTPTANTIHPKSSNDVALISPKSCLIESSSTEEIILDGRKVKQERLDEDDDHDDHEELRVDEWGCNKEFSISDIVMNDEFFADLEDF